MANGQGVEAVERALQILECFDDRKARLSLADLSRETGFYKSTILRLAASLERFAYLDRAANGAFRLGPAVWRLGSAYRKHFPLAQVLRPELDHLCAATDETASFYIRQGNQRVCLVRSEPERAIRHSISEGASLPLGVGASGRILMAYSESSWGSGEAIRAAGHAISMGERDPDVSALSVPIIDASENLLGALALSGLITRFSEDRRQVFLRALIDSKARLERALAV